MVFDRWARWTPLTGVLFVVLVLIGGPALAQSAPDAGASASSVISFYTVHQQRERAGAIALALSFAVFLGFAAMLRARFRRQQGQEGLAALLLATATVVVVGETVSSGAVYALTDSPARLSAATAQTLNLVKNDVVLTSAVGFLCFGLTAGVLVLRDHVLPSWLGVLAIVIAVLFVTPLEFVAFLLLLVWIAVISVLLMRSDRAPATAAAPQHPSPA